MGGVRGGCRKEKDKRIRGHSGQRRQKDTGEYSIVSGDRMNTDKK
jgi:hypothetical protein